MDGSLDSDAHGKQSAPSSAALWSYSKQLSSRGFSRAFAKVFGPPASTAKDEKAQSNTPIEETNHSSINDDDDDRKEHADSGLSHSIVDAEMADGTLRGEECPDNQDLAVQTLLNLKRDHSQDPSHISAKPTAKKAKPSAQRVNQKPLPGEKLPRKNTRTKASSSRTELTRSPKEVLYRPLSVNDLVSQRQEILSAVALVTRTLLSGSYPSPYKVSLSGYTNDESISRPTNDTTTLHVTHMRAVCASLEKFTNDIIIPSFVGELHSTLVPESFRTDADLSLVDPGSKHVNSDATKERKDTEATNKESTLQDSVLRAFFGTLVLLREVLVQNFDSVFGANAASGLPLEEQSNDSNGESMIDVLSKQIFVTAIVLTGISIFFGGNCDDTKRDQSEELIQAFFTCIDKYDRGHADFANCLQIVDDRTVAVLPNQRQMNEIEHRAWQLSCNFQRSRHPLYYQAMNRLELPGFDVDEAYHPGVLEERRKAMMRIPASTAVHISILKIQTTSNATEPQS